MMTGKIIVRQIIEVSATILTLVSLTMGLGLILPAFDHLLRAISGSKFSLPTASGVHSRSI